LNCLIADLTRSLSSSNQTLATLEKEKGLILNDLETLKKTLMQLEKSKDGSDSKIMKTSMENEHLMVVLDSLSIEKEALQSSLNAEVKKEFKSEFRKAKAIDLNN
jgi:hypothetical protein